MAACLNDLSIPAIPADEPDGQMRVDISPLAGTFAWVDADGAGTSATDTESMDLFDTASREGRALLWIGGADRTEEYLNCIETTDYTKPGPYADPQVERSVKQTEVDLNNDFAACARANGYPEVTDVPPPVIDGGKTSQSPPVMLPLRTTEEGLRELLAACPPLDEDRLRVMARGEDPSHIDTTIGPWITVDIPPDAGAESAQWLHFIALRGVIGEVSNEILTEFKERLAAEGTEYNGPEIEF
jgi:hypothetical protein